MKEQLAKALAPPPKCGDSVKRDRSVSEENDPLASLLKPRNSLKTSVRSPPKAIPQTISDCGSTVDEMPSTRSVSTTGATEDPANTVLDLRVPKHVIGHVVWWYINTFDRFSSKSRHDYSGFLRTAVITRPVANTDPAAPVIISFGKAQELRLECIMARYQ